MSILKKLIFICFLLFIVCTSSITSVQATTSTAKCVWTPPPSIITPWSIRTTGKCDIDVRDMALKPGCVQNEEILVQTDCTSKTTQESCTGNFLECHLVEKPVTCSGQYPHLSKNGDQCCKTCNANSCSNCVVPSIDTGAKCTSTNYYYYELKGGKCVRLEKEKKPVFLCLGDASCQTAIGDIKTKPDEFITSLLKIALPVAGFILLLGIIYIGYLVLTSQGNPEKLKIAKEVAVSIITGFIMLVFSFAILNAISQGFLGIKP